MLDSLPAGLPHNELHNLGQPVYNCQKFLRSAAGFLPKAKIVPQSCHN